MEDSWKRVMAAIALSVALPQLIVNIGSRMQPRASAQTETVGTSTATETKNETEPKEEPATETVLQTQAPEAEPIMIPVIGDDGTVVPMELETYVRGVVLAEMPASFETEALKAQAVVARTYALRRLTKGDRHSEGAICTESTCCQAWISDEDYLAKRGTQANWEKIADAVEVTAGLVLTYAGKLAETTYFSCSGGRTEDAAAVWGSEVPYLQAVDSPGEEGAASYEREVYFTKAQFAKALGRELSGSPKDWLGKVTYTDGDGVATMVIGGITYTGKQLRKLLGLNSTAFTMTADSGGITVVTRGKGHRVGMSQYGADAMAVAGSDFTQILAHYYQGTEIDKITEID